jgi:hypothetical protein
MCAVVDVSLVIPEKIMPKEQELEMMLEELTWLLLARVW